MISTAPQMSQPRASALTASLTDRALAVNIRTPTIFITKRRNRRETRSAAVGLLGRSHSRSYLPYVTNECSAAKVLRRPWGRFPLPSPPFLSLPSRLSLPPSLSLSSPPPPLSSLCLHLEVGPLPARGMGERCDLPQQGPQPKSNLVNFSRKIMTSNGGHF